MYSRMVTKPNFLATDGLPYFLTNGALCVCAFEAPLLLLY